MKRENIFILGTGYLGYNLAQHLSKNHNIVVIGLSNEYSKMFCDNIIFHELDLSKSNSLDNYNLEGGTIINAIGNANSLNCITDVAEEISHIDMICSIILSLNKKNIKKFIQLSSGGTVYGDPTDQPIFEHSQVNPFNIYALSKVFIEYFLKINYYEQNLNYCIARISNPYGGYQSSNKQQGIIPIIINKVLNELPLKLWVSLDNIRDYIYIDDFIDAMSIIITKDINNCTINVGTGVGVKLNKIISLVEQKLQKKAILVKSQSMNKEIKSNILNIDKLRSFGFDNKVSLSYGIDREIKRLKQK